MMKTPVYLSRPAVTSALGNGLRTHIDALLMPSETSPLTFSDQWVKGKTFAFGAVNETLRPLPDNLSAAHRSRNNQLLWHALEQIEDDIRAAVRRYGAARTAVIMGTSTSGADENIPLFQHVADGGGWADKPFNQLQHEMASPSEFVAHVYGIHGLRYVVSTACTSGARALISAARLLRSGLCDAVVCGGVDTLSPLTINGFASLEVLSDGLANPFSANRDGINIGEAAAAFVMTRDADFGGTMQLLGYGASSDAYHMSSHGTGTKHNDSMESRAVAEVFGSQTFCTSTKPQTGHTLGAAGAIEAAFAWGIADRGCNPQGKLPPQQWDGIPDPELPAVALTDGNSVWPSEKRIAASSSFAFGGSNAVLVIGEAAED